MSPFPNRRQILSIGASGLVHAQTKRPDVIIDVHTHFDDPSRPHGVPSPSKRDAFLYWTVLPRHFRDTTKSCGDVRTVVVEASPWVEDNQWLLDLAKDEPVIVAIVGNIRPGTPDYRANVSLNHLPYQLPDSGPEHAAFQRDLEALAEFPKLDTNPEGYSQLYRIFGSGMSDHPF